MDPIWGRPFACGEKNVKFRDYEIKIDDCFVVETGKGIADGGATKPVIGLDTWQSWTQVLQAKDRLGTCVYESCRRRFRFGNQAAVASKQTATFDVLVFGKPKTITIWLVPGTTPMLCSRSCFENWGIAQDFREGKVMMKDHPELGWLVPDRDDKSHRVIDLINGFPDREDEILNEDGSDKDTDSTASYPDDSDAEPLFDDDYYNDSTANYDYDDLDMESADDIHFCDFAKPSYDVRGPSPTEPGNHTLEKTQREALTKLFTDYIGHLEAGSRPKAVWEVLLDEGNVSHYCGKYVPEREGLPVRPFE